MTRLEFIESIIRNYEQARVPTIPHTRIQRGRSRSISSITEDILAFFIAHHIDNISIKVNQSLTHPNFNIMPDLSIIKHGKLTRLIEIKQDFGWCRNLHEFTEKFDDEIFKLIEVKKVTATNKFNRNNDEELDVSEDLSRCFVLISDRNISKKQLEHNKKQFSKCSRNKLLFLTTGCHPNSYKLDHATKIKTIRINHEAFDTMLSLAAI